MDKEQYIKKDRSETRYYSDEKMTVLHRSDGPAIMHESGYKCWYLNGELHREDGPAIEGAHGYNYWFQYGKRHRLDGPAIEWTNGILMVSFIDQMDQLLCVLMVIDSGIEMVYRLAPSLVLESLKH